MFESSFLARAPSPPRKRWFRIFVAVLGTIVIALLSLQYTHFRILPERKTDTLWGVLVGIAAMTGFAEYRWAATNDRDRAG